MERWSESARWNLTDVNNLAASLRGLPPAKPKAKPRYTTPALKLLACVLSLNRKWHEFVVPMVDDFKDKHSTVNTLIELHSLVSACGGPTAFFANELKFDYPERARTFDGVLDYMIDVTKRYGGTNELERLRRWAVSVQPKDYKEMVDVPGSGKANVPGFALAGWQYLRMLFGADTCKPDIYVKRFVRECLGRYVSGLSVVELMEAAAPHAGLSVREADSRIWRLKPKKNPSCHSA